MPMFTIAFRFPALAPPAEDFTRAVEDEVGHRGAQHLEDLTVQGSHLSVASMKFVILIYVAKVCLARGAVCVDGTCVRELPIALPPWASTRWVDHGWLARARISLGSMTLKPPEAQATAQWYADRRR